MRRFLLKYHNETYEGVMFSDGRVALHYFIKDVPIENDYCFDSVAQLHVYFSHGEIEWIDAEVTHEHP